ncbi:electron transport complex subunit G [Shewanella sp. NFH-SH190041]|uniref:electron transport complex subunit RsxG n=1 Tax=Shewanella sp. NFH-SH190041 TaxID=2950245 RepID=UPI0021C3C14B|nr:electron transport complex subunit RsxG [Shewanella sp. NFH-SH190041]BDM64008.1 electron transport complex subunit G [Shewanella sp. NFH-SH190041]
MQKSMIRNGLVLAIFALICTALVAVVNHVTASKIKQQEQAQLLQILHQIIPDNIHDNLLTNNCIMLHNKAALGTDDAMPAYIATHKGEPVAIAMETIAPDGYSGAIKLIVGINAQGEVLGVRTLAQNETPGLGDKIELKKSNWVLGFNHKTINGDHDKRWNVKKDGGEFDQFTGATITPRAYVKAVRKTLLYFKHNKQQIFAQQLNCGAKHE